jgi:hypothetical protein
VNTKWAALWTSCKPIEALNAPARRLPRGDGELTTSATVDRELSALGAGEGFSILSIDLCLHAQSSSNIMRSDRHAESGVRFF